MVKLLPESGRTQYLNCFDLLGENKEWHNETLVEIAGYSENAMEPRISKDQNILFFNNKTADDEEMDVHYAVRTEPIKFPHRYVYKGVLKGADSNKLDGTPGIDKYGNFYFASLRDYPNNYQSLYSAQLIEVEKNVFELKNIIPADDYVTRAQKMMIDMDGEVTWDGRTMIASRADFITHKAGPRSSYLALFEISFTDAGSKRIAVPKTDGSYQLANINLPECRVYAGAMSEDNLELYYTALPARADVQPNDFRIVVAKRSSPSAPFGRGQIISAIKGNVIEGPSVSMNDKASTLYYHKLDEKDNRFKIYKVSRN